MINGNVSHWWTDLGTPVPRPGVEGDLDVDVAIVGGGYTGLWTAYYLKQAKPDAHIAILEARFCGFGASGRNGGWLTNSVTGGINQYVSTHGREAARDFQLAMNATVDEVIRVAAAEGIDADIVKGGDHEVAYAPAQLARLDGMLADDESWDGIGGWQRLDATAAKERINVAGTLGALWSPHTARIHPAKLARGLSEVVAKLGVEIYEGTRVDEFGPARP